MKKQFFLFIAFCLFSSSYSVENEGLNSGSIVNSWTWEKSIGNTSNPYTSTPQTIGFNKKVVFTSEGRVITYKNNVEIRNSTYQIEKGISAIDQSQQELITFEGKTYVIEKLDNQNLTIATNNQDATRTIFKR